MRGSWPRGAVALAGGLLALGGLGLAGSPEAAARPAAASCTDAAGITVIVDFGSAGGGVQTRCAPAPVANGFEALTRAGFTIRNVSSQPGFLCQIDDKPESDCAGIPPAGSYWSYWYASRGEPWTYSTSSASRKPPPGSVEGWSFGSGAPPGAAPPAPIPPPTTEAPPPTAPSGPAPTGAPAPTTAGSSTTTTPSGSAWSATTVTAGVGDTGGAGTTSTSRAGGRSSTAGADDEDEQAVGVAAGATRNEGQGGSPLEWLAAAVVLGALGVTGARTVRRRSTREPEG